MHIGQEANIYKVCSYSSGRHTREEANLSTNDVLEPSPVGLEADLVPYYWCHGSAAGEHAKRPTHSSHHESLDHFLGELARNRNGQ